MKPEKHEKGPARETEAAAHPSLPEVGAANISGRIERYVPRGVPSDLWLATLRPFVVPALHAADPVGLPSFEQSARVLTLIAKWCEKEGIPLELERVLDPDTVERFCESGLKGFPSAGVYRTVLRRLGRRLTTQAPWAPPPAAMTHRKVARPYSMSELEMVIDDAHQQSTQVREQAALGVLGLGLGAGLDGRWCPHVRGVDVSREGGIVFVSVGRRAPRRVPVWHDFEEMVVEAAERAGEGFIVGGDSIQPRNRLNKLLARVQHGRGHPTLAANRLRSNWIVAHLQAGTRQPELMRAAGTQRSETFDELLGYVEPMDPDTEARMLRGPG